MDSLERGEISLTGMEISPYKQSQAGSRLVAGMKVQRYRRKLFLTTVKTIQCNKIVPASGMKFSHINTREIHPAYWAVLLSGPARLPYI